ncbi:MAG: hypothetical protein HZB26_09480 [Candidatus Hydrogenedentes bacterium]|nr:hypothetical protein [Candidatus Hydrogenedentota bacterium]
MTNSIKVDSSGNTGVLGFASRAFLIAVLTGWSAVTIYGWNAALRQTTDLDYAEGWHVYAAQQAFPGGHHAGAVRAVPHNVLPYPPLGYILNGTVGKALGGGLEATRKAGHYCAFGFTLIAALLIVCLCRMLGARWSYSAFAAVVFLNLHSIQLFAVSLRPYALSLTLTLLAVYVSLRFNTAWAAGVLLTLAVFAKHSYISVPAVFFSGYCIGREWKSVYALVLGAVVTCVVAVWVSLWTMGPHWLEGPLLQGFHGAKPGQVLYLMFIACRGAALPLAAGLAVAAMPGLTRPARFLSAAMIVSFLLNVVAMVKPGASMNYVLEPAAFALVLAAYGLEHSLPRVSARARAALWLATALTLLLLPGLDSIVALRAARAETAGASNREDVLRYLKGVQGPILATESWMYFESNHEPWVCPSDLVSVAVEGGIIPAEPMLERLRSGYFSAIAMTATARTERPFPASWTEAIARNYSLDKNINGVEVYVPKPENMRKVAP